MSDLLFTNRVVWLWKKSGSGSGRRKTALHAGGRLRAVVDAYTDEERFAMYGGDREHAVMDAPGTFDVSQVQEMEDVLGLPSGLASDIEEAASMVHMMNGNVFTGAAYRLREGTDQDAFAQAVKTALLEKRWMCGQPDTMLVLSVDHVYVITAFGEA